MTVSSSTSRIEYTGNAVTTAFSFPYYFLANGDLKVYLNGVLQTITTHYTVAGAGVGAGGTVTFVTAPPNAQLVVIYREVALTQSVDYTPNDPFPANTHEQALDRLTMITQQLDEESGRALALPSTSTYENLTLPDPQAGYYLQWKTNLSGLQNVATMSPTVYDVSPFVETLLNDVNAAAFISTLGITASVAELNIIDGVTSSTAELNILDGVTATFTELNYLDKSSALGTTEASKVLTADANLDVAAIRHLGATGNATIGGNATISGNATIVGAVIGSSPKFAATMTTGYVYSTPDAVIFNTESFDVGNYYNAATGVYTPLVAGYYLVTAVVAITASTVTASDEIQLRRNGTTLIETHIPEIAGPSITQPAITFIVYMNGSTDYLTITISTNCTVTATGDKTLFSATLLP